MSQGTHARICDSLELNEVKLVKIGTLYRAFHKLDNAVLFVETLAETVVSVDVR